MADYNSCGKPCITHFPRDSRTVIFNPILYTLKPDEQMIYDQSCIFYVPSFRIIRHKML